MDLVRENLMTQPGYAPYCGNDACTSFRRSRFDGDQFVCPACGWRSQFPADFITEYKTKWHKRPNVQSHLDAQGLSRGSGGLAGSAAGGTK